MWQPYGVPGEPSDHNVFECNWAADNLELNSHFVQIRDPVRRRSGEKEFVIRGNVALRMGSYACQFGAIDKVHFYNNTLVDLCVARAAKKSWVTIGFNKEGDDPSLGDKCDVNAAAHERPPASTPCLPDAAHEEARAVRPLRRVHASPTPHAFCSARSGSSHAPP